MIQIVTSENRRLFHHALLEMHEQRKVVFIDRMRWRLEESAGLEIDAFDSAEAIYLLETDERGRVRQSARLLKTSAPHLMSEVFPQLCPDGVPRGASVWEATRFCPAPDVAAGAPRRQCLGRMIAAIMEAAILFGVGQVSFVAGAALAPSARDAGWDVRPLGPQMRIGRERLVAMLATISLEGLARVRARHGLSGPLTRYADTSMRVAA